MKRTSMVAASFLALTTVQAMADAVLPAFNTVSEDLSEQRRAVFVRLEHRLTEADLLLIAEHIKDHSKRSYARTQVNCFLPGMPMNQGPWASVQFAPDPKVLVQGLRREDEELFIAEHQGDKRALLGSWLTSPPAAPGRLTIYSDRGRIYAEWRLRNGQKTLDELQDTISKAGRRFDVQGGGYYVLAKSGELEIWDKTTLIATAERIRPEHLSLPAAVAIGPKLAPVITMVPAPPRLVPAEMVSSPAQPEPVAAAPVQSVTPGAATLAAAPSPLEPDLLDPKRRPKKVKKSRTAGPAPATHSQARLVYPGD